MVCLLFMLPTKRQLLAIFPRWVPLVRAEVIVTIFGRMLDLHHFSAYLLRRLSMTDMWAIVVRLGWLNIWNPSDPDWHYDLNLGSDDHHKLAELLAKLAITEPGENWRDQNYDDIPGWKLPQSWCVPDGVPRYVSPQHNQSKPL